MSAIPKSCQGISTALCRDTAFIRPSYCGTPTVLPTVKLITTAVDYSRKYSVHLLYSSGLPIENDSEETQQVGYETTLNIYPAHRVGTISNVGQRHHPHSRSSAATIHDRQSITVEGPWASVVFQDGECFQTILQLLYLFLRAFFLALVEGGSVCVVGGD